MFKTIQIIVLAVLCLNFSAVAQSEPTSSFSSPTKSAIRIGDIIPDYFYRIEHQAVQAKSVITFTLILDKYKNKLIILDFWATWCAPCVYSIKKIDSIQRTMNSNEFVVIPVTYQNARIAREFLKNQDMQMPSIILDTTLKTFFPHQGIPHQIWIKNGKVIAIPKWQYATESNIQKTINNEKTRMIMNVKDGVIDPTKPLFVKGNADTKSPLYFRSKNAVIAKRLPNFGQHKLVMISHADTTILYAYNLPIRGLFFEAFKDEIFKEIDDKVHSGIYWEISKDLNNRFFNGPKESSTADFKQDMLYEVWKNTNLYGYNLRVPGYLSKEDALKLMQQDLNTFFGAYFNIKATIELRPKQILVLKLLFNKKDTEKLLKSKGEKTFINNGFNGTDYAYKNVSFKSIYVPFMRVSPKSIFIDKTGIKNLLVDIQLSRFINDDLEKAQNELAAYGLSLQLEEMQVPVLVVKEGEAI